MRVIARVRVDTAMQRGCIFSVLLHCGVPGCIHQFHQSSSDTVENKRASKGRLRARAHCAASGPLAFRGRPASWCPSWHPRWCGPGPSLPSGARGEEKVRAQPRLRKSHRKSCSELDRTDMNKRVVVARGLLSCLEVSPNTFSVFDFPILGA